MPPQTHTFPCPFCGRRMGVGLDLLGRQVRCPHCKQVVVAPVPSGPPAAAPPPPPPPAPDPANPFGFGTAPAPARQPPPRPAPAPLPGTTPAADNPFAFGPTPAAPPPPPPPPRPVPPKPVVPPKPAAPPMPEAANAPVRGTGEESFTFDIPGKPTAPPRPAVPPPPPPVAPPPEPVFTFPHRETADSILSEPEESEDQVFGSGSGTRPPVVELPELPPDPPPPRPAPVSPPSGPAGDPFAIAAPPPPAPKPVPLPPPPPAAPVPRHLVESAALPNPFADLEPAPSLPPPPPPRPAPVPTPRPAAPANPWAGLDAEGTPAQPVPHAPAPVPAPAPARFPQPVPVEPLPLEAEPEEATKAPRGRPAADATVGVPKAVLYGLAGYALLMTLLAVYGLFIKSGDKLESGHPLSTIPDNFGEFDPASRKKVTMYKFPVDGDLPADRRAGLGEKIKVGQVVVEPVEVVKRAVKLVAVGRGERKDLPSPGEALALKLRVTNTSKDLTLFPLDPAFSRKEVIGDKPATRLVIDQKAFTGGPFSWPFPKDTRQFDAEQENDAIGLRPGETREYVVLSGVRGDVMNAARTARDTILWRVEVRRGLVEFRGKERPVNAIIGVEFKKDDVKGL